MLSDIIDTEDPPYDKLFDDGEKFKVGDIDARVIATLGILLPVLRT